MTAGLPGVGIGGMFYLVSAVLMPFRSLWNAVQGREARWALALRQASIAAATIGVLWATGWGVGWLIAMFTPATAAAVHGAGTHIVVQNAMRTAALLGSIGTLLVVLASVQVMRLILPPRVALAPTKPAAPRKIQSAA
jgi:hypothetical protein